MSSHAPQRNRSAALFEEARQYIPGGVNSPVRAFKSVGGHPIAIVRGKGSRVWDVDGNSYIDYVCSWGPLLFGHAPDFILEAIRTSSELGTSFGMFTEGEVVFAKELCAMVPSLQMVRLVNSGTEAVMSALRVARAATGRRAIVKFDGGYHGHTDALLSKAGSGLATQGLPDSRGVPSEFAALTYTIPFNDIDALRALLSKVGSDVACLIGEPIPGNMGVVPPAPGFWQQVQEELRKVGALLIFDEVITGFRAAPGGAQSLLGVTPDLTTLGKIIGGGLPMGAYGGRADLMSLVAPVGPVYQAGTLSGNPVVVAAGRAMLERIRTQAPHGRLEEKARHIAEGLRSQARKAGIPVCVNQVGSVLTLFFTDGPVTDYASAARSDTKRFAAFFNAMLDRGVALPPSQFEAWFLSDAHTEADLEATLRVSGESFATLV